MEYRMEGDVLKNWKGEKVAEVRGDRIVDEWGNLKAIIQGDRILDERTNDVARIQRDFIIDYQTSHEIAAVTEPSKHIANAGRGAVSAAIWLFFVR